MNASFEQILLFLVLGILLIVFTTTRLQLHAFFALLLAALLVGLGVGLPAEKLLEVMKNGFGHIMGSLGFIIVLGTTLGVLLEASGSTGVMADLILRTVGKKRSLLAMNLTGFIVGLPIFCDSGYIVLSGLNNSVARRTGLPVPALATSLAAGLYAVHCTVPPHPGAAAAAGVLDVDFGRLLLIGILVAAPASVVGFLWAAFIKNKLPHEAGVSLSPETDKPLAGPSAFLAFLPVVVPIALIGAGALLQNPRHGSAIFKVLGNPVLALAIGVLLAILTLPGTKRKQMSSWLQESAEKAGTILVIIGAGGAFGAVLTATNLGNHLAERLPLAGMGVFFPFLITSVIKTAQGSSTVAIITAASIVQPLLPALGLQGTEGKILCLLSMGGGSMMISHTNDAYFWVVSKFSGIELRTMLKSYTLASVWMGLTVLLVVFLLSVLWL